MKIVQSVNFILTLIEFSRYIIAELSCYYRTTPAGCFHPIIIALRLCYL